MPCLRRAIFLFLILPAWPFFVFSQEESAPPAAELDIEEVRGRIYGEAPQELMSFSLLDSGVSLSLTGSWKGSLQWNPGLSVSPLGTGFASPETPVFTQEADIILSLLINNKWFVEANFLDDSGQNTYRAGYQGLSGEFLQYVGIGNTGLDFPSFPYFDLGGDSPSSFGIYSRFGGGGLNVHALFRYDAAYREERVFSGGRERTYSYIKPENSIRGISFVLPDTDIDSEITVYIEDEKGNIWDSGGRRWRLALSTEYAASRAQGLLELTIRPSGMVAVAYSKAGNSRPWNASMGSYGTTGFLNTVQQWFASVNLENYTQCGNRGPSARPGEVIFGSIRALVIREPGTFSPFERQNRYDAPSSTSERADLVLLSSGEEIVGFQLVRLDTSASQADIPLYTAAVSRRNVYELLQSDSDAGGFSRRAPETCWPLAREFSEIYLPGAYGFSGGIALRFTNYNSTGGYFIGTDAVPGSIQVWRSGIQDANFNYNSSSGEVAIYGPAGQNELIRITYLKRSGGTRIGSIAAGLGAVYQSVTEPFSARAAVGMRWNLSDDSFTEEDLSSAGTVGLSAKAEWEYDFLKAHAAGGFTFEQTDTTGLYRAAGMEGNEGVLTLPPETSFLSQPPSSSLVTGLDYSNRASLVYRNYYNNNVLGSTLMTVDWNAPVVLGINRPYPVKDPRLGSYQVLTAEFSLESGGWTGFQVPLNYFSEILSRAAEIEIPFRFYGFSGNADDFQLIVQIGSLSGEDFAFSENQNLVWEKVLFTDSWPAPPDPNAFYSDIAFNSNARIARFTLTDEDRLKLGDAKYLRIIAVYGGIGGISGRVILAPPIVRGASFRPVVFDGSIDRVSFSADGRVTAVETIETGAASLGSAYAEIIRRLHPSDDGARNTQRVLKIEWKDLEEGISAGVDGRIGEMPFENYRALSFFVKGPPPGVEGALTFIASSGPDSISRSQLRADIPLSAFTAGQWSKVTIRYQGSGKGVFVDGVKAADAVYRPSSRRIGNSDPGTSYIAVFINPSAGSSLEDGSICIDEIILEDANPVYRMNAGAAVEYFKPGTLVSIGGIPVLADFSVSSAVESEARAGSGSENQQFSGSIVSRTGAEVSFFGVNISGALAFTAAEDTFLWSADHAVSRAFGLFSIGETFYASPYENSARHNFNMAYASDFYAVFEADALYGFSSLRQKWNLGAGYRSRNDFIPSVSLNAEAAWTREGKIREDENYGELWLRSWESMIPDTGGGAYNRRTSTQFVITEKTKPVGAVLTFEGSTNFSGANSITRSENSLFLDVPVVFSGASVDFKAGRGFKRHLFYSGENALDDGRKFFESISDSLPVWGVFPLFSLFTPKLAEAMDRGLDNSPSADIAQYTSFRDHFSTRINLPPLYNLSSFFIPSRITLRLERTLERKLDTRTDIFNLGGSLGFSSINMFGRFGYSPVFNFYQSDEFTHAVEAAVVIPQGEDVSWRIQSILGAGFRGFSGGVLNFVNTLTMRSGGYWLESFIAGWTAPAEKNLLSVFYNWVASQAEKQSSWLTLSSVLNSGREQLRRESLELTFDKSGDYLRWVVTAGHEEIVRIMGRLELTAFIKLKCGKDLYSEILIINALLGTTLSISF
jgi:DNA polymerase-4